MQTETLSIGNINAANGGIETEEFEDSFTNAEICMDTNVVSSAGKKRKLSEISITSEVSAPQKRACIESVKNVQNDHAYYVSCPSRLQWKVHDLIGQADSLKKSLDKSQKKSRRLKKKVESLTSVVSELKRKKLVSGDCASILETTFSGVPIRNL